MLVEMKWRRAAMAARRVTVWGSWCSRGREQWRSWQAPLSLPNQNRSRASKWGARGAKNLVSRDMQWSYALRRQHVGWLPCVQWQGGAGPRQHLRARR